MKPYNHNSFCHKCGCDNITSSYHPHSDQRCSNYSRSICYGEYGGHVLRHCVNCHHEWHEIPLDEVE
jgi:hypothetical protein